MRKRSQMVSVLKGIGSEAKENPERFFLDSLSCWFPKFLDSRSTDVYLIHKQLKLI